MNRSFAPWVEEWKRPAFRIELSATLVALVVAVAGLARFLEQNEGRAGVVLPDPVLALFPPTDLTWVTFTLIYAGLVTAIVVLLRTPRFLLIAFQSYAVMVVLRMIAMHLTPLAPPPTVIPLVDPLVQYAGTGRHLDRDLFFSGHTSTMFLLFLTARGRAARSLFLVCTIGVACCVLAQHVHYAVDVYVAPFFAYGAYRIVLGVRLLAERGLTTGGVA